MLLDLKKVFLSEDESLTIDCDLDLQELEFNGTRPLATPIKVSAQAVNRAGVVGLSVVARFEYDAPCDRCGERKVTDLEYSFEHTLVQSLVGENEGEYIETPDYQLDLDELVTADIVLELPSKYLCTDGCKGLCPKCGRNLNKGDCGCDTRQIDPRLEVLKNLL